MPRISITLSRPTPSNSYATFAHLLYATSSTHASTARACATYSFYAEIAFTSPSTSRLPLPAYLSLFKTLLTTHPGYIGQKFRIVDLSPVVDEKSETGNVFTNMEWYNPNEAGLQKRSDARGGLVKPAVGTWEFKRVGMQWVCVKFQVVPGITPTVGV